MASSIILILTKKSKCNAWPLIARQHILLAPDQQKAYQQALRDCGSDNRCQIQVARIYETLDDRQEIDKRVAQIQQVGDNVTAGAQAVYDAVTAPVQTVKNFVSGIGNLTPEAVADGLKQAADSQHQNHVDRSEAYVAGDSQALGQAEGNIATENLGALGLPGGIGVAGKVADVATDVLDASKANRVSGNGGNNGSYQAETDFGYLPPLRQKYVMDVDNLKKEVSSMQASGASLEEVAAFAYQRRNEIKKPILEATPPDLLNQITERNVRVYNNASGPTFEQFVNSGKTFDQIIESAARSGGGDIF